MTSPDIKGCPDHGTVDFSLPACVFRVGFVCFPLTQTPSHAPSDISYDPCPESQTHAHIHIHTHTRIHTYTHTHVYIYIHTDDYDDDSDSYLESIRTGGSMRHLIPTGGM